MACVHACFLKERIAMVQKNNEKLIIFVETLASVGIIIENYILHWVFFAPFTVLAGMVFLWFINF